MSNLLKKRHLASPTRQNMRFRIEFTARDRFGQQHHPTLEDEIATPNHVELRSLSATEESGKALPTNDESQENVDSPNQETCEQVTMLPQSL